jgi:hypothetical protein
VASSASRSISHLRRHRIAADVLFEYLGGCRIGGERYFNAVYRLEVFMDIQNKLSQSAAVTAGIAAAGLAVGAAVMGACAIGALAISAMAMRKVATRGGHVDKLSVGDLTVDRLLVKDSTGANEHAGR